MELDFEVKKHNAWDAVEIPIELKEAAQHYLALRQKQDGIEAAVEKQKQKVLDEFAKHPHLKTVDFNEFGQQIQKRETTKIIFDEQKVLGAVLNTKYFESVFKKEFNPMNITREEAEKAGLLNKCLTRVFNADLMQDLLALQEFSIKEFLADGVMKTESKFSLARVGLETVEKQSKFL